MKRMLLPTVILFAGLSLALTRSSTAQNDADASTVKRQTPLEAAQTQTQYRGPLPFYFGKLGLDEAQKEKLYAIDEDYSARIAEIEKQIQKLKDERDAKMEVLLTPGQKLRLKELRDEAAKRAARDAADKAAAEASPPAAE